MHDDAGSEFRQLEIAPTLATIERLQHDRGYRDSRELFFIIMRFNHGLHMHYRLFQSGRQHVIEWFQQSLLERSALPRCEFVSESYEYNSKGSQ